MVKKILAIVFSTWLVIWTLAPSLAFGQLPDIEPFRVPTGTELAPPEEFSPEAQQTLQELASETQAVLIQVAGYNGKSVGNTSLGFWRLSEQAVSQGPKLISEAKAIAIIDPSTGQTMYTEQPTYGGSSSTQAPSSTPIGTGLPGTAPPISNSTPTLGQSSGFTPPEQQTNGGGLLGGLGSLFGGNGDWKSLLLGLGSNLLSNWLGGYGGLGSSGGYGGYDGYGGTGYGGYGGYPSSGYGGYDQYPSYGTGYGTPTGYSGYGETPAYGSQGYQGGYQEGCRLGQQQAGQDFSSRQSANPYPRQDTQTPRWWWRNSTKADYRQGYQEGHQKCYTDVYQAYQQQQQQQQQPTQEIGTPYYQEAPGYNQGDSGSYGGNVGFADQPSLSTQVGNPNPVTQIFNLFFPFNPFNLFAYPEQVSSFNYTQAGTPFYTAYIPPLENPYIVVRNLPAGQYIVQAFQTGVPITGPATLTIPEGTPEESRELKLLLLYPATLPGTGIIIGNGSTLKSFLYQRYPERVLRIAGDPANPEEAQGKLQEFQRLPEAQRATSGNITGATTTTPTTTTQCPSSNQWLNCMPCTYATSEQEKACQEQQEYCQWVKANCPNAQIAY